jgi:hypothetical protein
LRDTLRPRNIHLARSLGFRLADFRLSEASVLYTFLQLGYTPSSRDVDGGGMMKVGHGDRKNRRGGTLIRTVSVGSII